VRQKYESIKWGRGHCERIIFRGKHVDLQRFVYSWKGVLGTVAKSLSTENRTQASK